MLETVLGRKREMLALKAWDMVSSISLNQEMYIMYIFSFVLVCWKQIDKELPHTSKFEGSTSC